MRSQPRGPRVVFEPRVARQLDENLAQSLGKAPWALTHVRAGNYRIGPVHRTDIRRARTFRFGRHEARAQIAPVRGKRSRSLRARISGGQLRLRAGQRGRQEQLQKYRPLPCSNRVPAILPLPPREPKPETIDHLAGANSFRNESSGRRSMTTV